MIASACCDCWFSESAYGIRLKGVVRSTLAFAPGAPSPVGWDPSLSPAWRWLDVRLDLLEPSPLLLPRHRCTCQASRKSPASMTSGCVTPLWMRSSSRARYCPMRPACRNPTSSCTPIATSTPCVPMAAISTASLPNSRVSCQTGLAPPSHQTDSGSCAQTSSMTTACGWLTSLNEARKRTGRHSRPRSAPTGGMLLGLPMGGRWRRPWVASPVQWVYLTSRSRPYKCA